MVEMVEHDGGAVQREWKVQTGRVFGSFGEFEVFHGGMQPR